MPVVGVLVDQGVGPRVGLDRVRADEVGAGDQVPEVAVDRIDEERLAQRGPVVAPGIGRPVGQHLEPLADRVIAPEPAAHGHAERCGRARDADLAGRGGPATAVEPAIGPPSQAVGERVVVLDGDPEPVEHDLGGTVGHVVAVAVGDEQQPGRAEQPDAAEAELDAAEALDVVGEDRAPVGPAVAVGVLEDQDPIAEPQVEPIGAVRRKCSSRRSRAGRGGPRPWRSGSGRRARRRTRRRGTPPAPGSRRRLRPVRAHATATAPCRRGFGKSSAVATGGRIVANASARA